jgi:hypothetical protein
MQRVNYLGSYVICHFVLRLDAFGAEEVLERLLLLAVVKLVVQSVEGNIAGLTD